ncbi:Mitochondrial outer membrane protein porin 2 [Linum grandiflorum]
MSKGPGIFSDIGKKARDLLTAGYSSDQKFSVSTRTGPSKLAITSAAASKGGLSTGDVGVVYKYKDHVFDVKVDTLSNIATNFVFLDVLPSTKAVVSFKFPDYNSGKLEVQYFHPHATLTSAVNLHQSPAVDVSVTAGTPAIAFGVEAAYSTSSGNFTKYNAGVGITNRDAYASVILGDKGDTMTASYTHHLDELKRSAAVGEIMRRFSTNENTFTVGGSYAIDNLTMFKGKLNNHGKLAALMQHEFIPQSVMTISGEVDTKALDKNPKFGISVVLKPE